MHWIRISWNPLGNFFLTICWDESYIQQSLSTTYMCVIFLKSWSIVSLLLSFHCPVEKLKALSWEMGQQVLVPKPGMGFWPVLKQKLGIWGCQLQELELEWSELWGQRWALPRLFESFQDEMGRWKLSPFETQKTNVYWGQFWQLNFTLNQVKTGWVSPIKNIKPFSNWTKMIENGKYLLFGLLVWKQVPQEIFCN